MRFLLSFIIFLASFTASAHREDNYFLKGLFGTRQVGIRIDEYSNICYARYFFMEDRKDHVMEGNILPDSTFVLNAYRWDSARNQKIVTETLIVRHRENHQWEGTWNPGTGDFDVFLYPISSDPGYDQDTILNPEFSELYFDPYSYLRTADLKFKELKTSRIGKGLKVKWVMEPVSGIKMFRVVQGWKNRQDFTLINKLLTTQHRKIVNDKLSCSYIYETGDFEFNCKIRYLDNYLVSYSMTSTSSCFGGNPELNTVSETRSMQSGDKFILEDLIWFGEGPPPTCREGSQDWFKYRYQVFGDSILNILKKIYPDKFTGPVENDCHYNQTRNWQFPEWHFTGDGLHVGSRSVSENRKCDNQDWSVIPWKYLEKYLVPGTWSKD